MEDLFHEIVKYPPSGYNKDGIYMCMMTGLPYQTKKLKLYFSYDYYLNIKCPINKITLNEIVKKNNLYLDPRG